MMLTAVVIKAELLTWTAAFIAVCVWFIWKVK